MTLTYQDIQTTKPTADTTSQSIVFFIFHHPHFLKTFLMPLTSGTLGFAATQKANARQNPKSRFFAFAQLYFLLLEFILKQYER